VFYNRDGICLPRGTDWIFKNISGILNWTAPMLARLLWALLLRHWTRCDVMTANDRDCVIGRCCNRPSMWEWSHIQHCALQFWNSVRWCENFIGRLKLSVYGVEVKLFLNLVPPPLSFLCYTSRINFEPRKSLLNIVIRNLAEFSRQCHWHFECASLSNEKGKHSFTRNTSKANKCRRSDWKIILKWM
jgi:hypothetical protein